MNTKKASRSFLLKNISGFTLVELMVVVAIIGILAAIAIPNYQKFQARARQTEAKIALAGVYTAEMSFTAENGSFTGCLRAAGFTPTGTNFYYTTGFKQAIVAAAAGCGTGGATSCNVYAYPTATTCVVATAGEVDDLANAFVGAGPATGDGDLVAASSKITTLITNNTFTAGSTGNVSKGAVMDGWTMTELKALSNVQAGI